MGVSNFQRAMSMVIPRSRSDFSLSITQAYLKEPWGRKGQGGTQKPKVDGGSRVYLARLLGLLLELLDGPLVDTSALVDQVPGGRGLAYTKKN